MPPDTGANVGEGSRHPFRRCSWPLPLNILGECSNSFISHLNTEMVTLVTWTYFLGLPTGSTNLLFEAVSVRDNIRNVSDWSLRFLTPVVDSLLLSQFNRLGYKSSPLQKAHLAGFQSWQKQWPRAPSPPDSLEASIAIGVSHKSTSQCVL
jgi:hypothetical protein